LSPFDFEAEVAAAAGVGELGTGVPEVTTAMPVAVVPPDDVEAAPPPRAEAVAAAAAAAAAAAGWRW